MPPITKPRCPKNSELLEYVSMPDEIPRGKKLLLQVHLKFCGNCQKETSRVRDLWQACLDPEPDITPSLLRIYGKLKKDETLILKGWKLDESHSRPSLGARILSQGWLFRGGVALGGLGAAFFVLQSQPSLFSQHKSVAVESIELPPTPLAQFRVERKNRVQVRYVKPELMESVEFETASLQP